MTTSENRTPQGRVALVEDDPNIRESTRIFLSSQGFHVETFNSAEAFLTAHAGILPFEVLLLDLNLPGATGLSLCEKIKKRAEAPAVIIITAQNDEKTAVMAFDLGADDFIRKPFGLKELNSRLQRVLLISSKMTSATKPHVAFQGISLDTKSRSIKLGNKLMSMTRTEFLIMQTLLGQPEVIVSREALADKIELNLETSARTLDVHLSRIRNKLLQSGISEISIQSIYGKGYLLEKKNENS
jgi:two-component system response regulator ResD